MILTGDVGKVLAEEIMRHRGHMLLAVTYGHDMERPVNYAIECEDCQCVLLDTEEQPDD